MGYTAGYLTSVQDFTGDVNGPVLWNLNLLDARFNAVSETYGNGLWLQNGYDALTGAPVVRRSGTGGLEDNVQNLGYAWDAAGNLTGRSDLRQSLSETFQYDALDRLTQATGPGAQATSVGYDAIGNLTSKSGVGSSFAYHPTKKHALTSAGGTAHGYDGNGNLTSRGGATVAWSSANYPTAIGDPNGYSAQFSYTPDRSRWCQVSTYAGATETTVYVGGLLQKFTNAVTTHWKHLIPTPSGEVQVIRRANGSTETLYVTTDHLGSTDAVLDAAGAVVMRASFAAQGERRASGWQGVPPTAEWQAIAATTRRGYTGHETLDNVMLVHMNGRVYDPRIGRFLSADPYIDGADTTQGWNRYSYVHNIPLNAADPSGFWELPDIDEGIDPPGGLFTGGGGGYIYGSRIPEREPNRMRNSVLAQREADLYVDQYAGSAIVGTNAVSAGDATLAVLGVVAIATPVPGDEAILLGAGGARVLSALAGSFGVAAIAKTANDRVAEYISGIVERATGGRDQYQYALVALTAGPRPNVRGGVTYLNVGDVYKYGTSINPAERYTPAELTGLNVVPISQYYGTATYVLIQEKLRLLGYFSEYGTLPPGNKIWR